jgi:hypothetical protein
MCVVALDRGYETSDEFSNMHIHTRMGQGSSSTTVDSNTLAVPLSGNSAAAPRRKCRPGTFSRGPWLIVASCGVCHATCFWMRCWLCCRCCLFFAHPHLPRHAIATLNIMPPLLHVHCRCMRGMQAAGKFPFLQKKTCCSQKQLFCAHETGACMPRRSANATHACCDAAHAIRMQFACLWSA